MKLRRLDPGDVSLIGSIDRSEHVELQCRVEDGRLVEAPVSIADIPPWDPDGSGEHTVAAHIAFCASVVADGAALLGAFDEDGDLMGLATVHPTFEPRLAWLATLHVTRRHRRRRAASALWEASIELGRAAGARSIYVSATPLEAPSASTSAAGVNSPTHRTRSSSPTSPTTSTSFAHWRAEQTLDGTPPPFDRCATIPYRSAISGWDMSPRCRSMTPWPGVPDRRPRPRRRGHRGPGVRCDPARFGARRLRADHRLGSLLRSPA
jgi:hypothetical protein